jgi:hypothetical protein
LDSGFPSVWAVLASAGGLCDERGDVQQPIMVVGHLGRDGRNVFCVAGKAWMTNAIIEIAAFGVMVIVLIAVELCVVYKEWKNDR